MFRIFETIVFSVIVVSVTACGGGGSLTNAPPSLGGLSLNAAGSVFSAIKDGPVPQTHTITATITNPDAAFIGIEWNENWIAATLDGADDTWNVTLTIKTTALPIAVYSDTLVVSIEDENGAVLASQNLAISYNVVPGLIIRDSIRFSQNQSAPMPPSGWTSINGTSALQWTASKNQNWILLGSAAGTVPTSVAIGYNATGFAVGSYSGVITFTPNEGAAVDVKVGLEVYSPALVPSPGSQEFTKSASSSAPELFMPAIHTNVGPLAFTVASNVGWAILDSASGTAPANVRVTVDPVGLSPGIYDGVITFLATVSGSPVSSKLHLRLNVVP